LTGLFVSFLKSLRKPIFFILLLVSLIVSFIFSTFLANYLGRFQFNTCIEIFHIRVNLVAGFFFPLLAAILFLHLLMSLRESITRTAFVLLSLLFMTLIVYSIRLETRDMVVFDPKTMLFLAFTSLFLGISAFYCKRPTTLAADNRLLGRVLFFSSGIMWLSGFIAELIVLFRWQNEGVLIERINYMVLGGAGFNDVLAFYGIVTTFTSILFFIVLNFISLFFGNLLVRNVRVAIYRDIKYPTSWIDNNFSLRITNLSEYLCAEIVNAEQLRTFMRDSISQKTSHLRLVVFSQDIVPTTVLDDYSSTNTFREFLDAGGSILWIGDIPLFYAGDYNREFNEPFRRHIWESGAPLHILGLTHVYSNPKSTVHITDMGFEIGLKRKWSGVRPTVRDKFIKPLAYSENLNLRPYTNIPPRRSLLMRFLDFLRRIKVVGPTGIEFRPPTTQETEIGDMQFHKTHLNAWIKIFNPNYPFSGFYRIWDYNPQNVTDEMIEEIGKIVKVIKLKLADQY